MSQLLKALKQLESAQLPSAVRPAVVALDVSKPRVAINELFDEAAASVRLEESQPVEQTGVAEPARAPTSQTGPQMNLDALQLLLAEELQPLDVPAEPRNASGSQLRRGQATTLPPEPFRRLQPIDPLNTATEDLANELLAARAEAQTWTVLIHAIGRVAGTAACTARVAHKLSELQPANVLVIDTSGDAAFGRTFGVRPSVGILDVLTGKRRLADVLQGTGVPRITFIGAGQPDNATAHSQAAAIVAELRREFPLILIHSGNSSSLAIDLARCCDATYLALELGATAHRAANQMKARLAKSGAQLMGCIALDPNS